jgi:DNA-binding MarR family transcriptional regulator
MSNSYSRFFLAGTLSVQVCSKEFKLKPSAVLVLLSMEAHSLPASPEGLNAYINVSQPALYPAINALLTGGYIERVTGNGGRFTGGTYTLAGKGQVVVNRFETQLAKLMGYE